MLRPIIVLWLAAPSLVVDHRADIEAWARAQGRRPVWPEASLATVAYDATIAEEVEALLEAARSASPGDRGAFDQIEQLLHAHPELPQAAWWMAERHAIEAHQLRDTSGAAPAAELARKLEGPRAAAFGLSMPAAPALADGAAAPPITGVRPGDRVLVDGSELEKDTRLEAGRHHVQVFREQRRISAAWVVIGDAELSLPDPTRPCSELDLLGTRATVAAPEPPAGAACEAWAAAQPNGAGGTLVARCRGSSCEPWQALAAESEVALPISQIEAQAPSAPSGVPTWVTWGAVGLGSIVATGLVLWQAGAFDGPTSDTEFTFTGPTAIAF
jgi:hypothetical protein